MALGENLKSARLHRKMTLAALAAVSGVTKGFLSQVENGRSKPSLGSLERIAGALGMPVARLLDSALGVGDAGLSHEGSALSSNHNLSPRSSVLTPTSWVPEEAAVVRSDTWRGSLEALTPVPADSSGRFAIARLLPGWELLPTSGGSAGGVRGPEGTPLIRFCCVLEGDLVFNQGGMEVAVSRSDSITWKEGRAGQIENRGNATAYLLLAPGDFGLWSIASQKTELETQNSKLKTRGPSGGQTYDATGPLRLAAMRAMRGESRKRHAGET